MKNVMCLGIAVATLARGAWAQVQGPAKPEAATASASPSTPADEAARPILREAVKLVKDQKPPARRGLPDFRAYMLQAGEQDRASALIVLADALTKVGDMAAARDSLEAASELVEEINDPAAKASVLHDIAKVQVALGAKADALSTAKQGLRQTRAIKGDDEMPMISNDNSVDATRVAWIRAFAEIQAEAGDAEAASSTFGQAVAAIPAIKDEVARVLALVEIAEARAHVKDTEGANAAWSLATDAAKLEDPVRAAKAIETILRGRIRGGAIDEAYAFAKDALSGDSWAYALWAIADSIVENKVKVGEEFVAKLRSAAESAEYDRPSKKVKTLTRVAEVQVRLKDYDGAIQTVDALADPTLPRYHSDGAKIAILRAIARARTESRDFGLARERLAEASELSHSFRDEDGLYFLDWTAFAVEQARAGDGDRAATTADSIGKISSRVNALAQVSAARAEDGDIPGARKTIKMALDQVGSIPSEMLWNPQPFEVKPRSIRLILVAQAIAGDFDSAAKTASEFPEPGSFVGDLERVEACEVVAPLRLKAGDFPGAMKTLALLDGCGAIPAGKKAEILAKMAAQQSAQGDLAAALAWVKELTDSKPRILALRGIGQGILDARAKTHSPTKE